MEMGRRSAMCEYFIVMSAASSVRVKAVVEHIEGRLGDHGHKARHREGLHESLWVLLDYGDVIVHVFYPETRRFYALESLWGDAPRRHYQSKAA